MSLDARVIRHLQYMLPHGLRLEDPVLRRKYSAQTMTDGAYIVLASEGRWDGQRVMYPVQKMLHFLFPDEHPKVFYSFNGKDSEAGSEDDKQPGQVVALSVLPPDEQKSMLAGFLTPKEAEVAEFLQGLQAQLSLASTKEETRAVLDEFIRITHLPAEVADTFYQRAHHHALGEDFPDFGEAARKEIDRAFCYEFSWDLTRNAHAFSMRDETSMLFPAFALGASVIDSLLLVGADVAYEAQEPKHQRLEKTQMWAGAYGKLIDPFDSSSDPYAEFALGLRMLMMTIEEQNPPQERVKEKTRLLEKYKHICADLAFGAVGFAFAEYQRKYAQLCYETVDRKGLENVLELQVMNVERHIEEHGLKDHCGFRRELFDEPIDPHLSPLVESLFLTWHARMRMQEKKGGTEDTPEDEKESPSANGTQHSETIDARIATIKQYVVDEVITERILKQTPPELGGMPLDILLHFNPAVHLAKYMGDPAVDYAVAEAIVTRAHDEHDGSHLLLATVMGRYFPQFSLASKHLDSRLEQTSYPHTFLKPDELQRWQERFAQLLIDNDYSREKRIWNNSFLYHMIHSRTSAFFQSAEHIKTGDLLKAREQWIIMGYDSPLLWSIQATELLGRYDTLTAPQKINLVRSCTQFIEEEPEELREAKKLLEQKIGRELKKETKEKSGIDFELFDAYMTTAARLRSYRVLCGGAEALRAHGHEIGRWFKMYWPLEFQRELPEKLKTAVYQEAGAHIDAREYAQAHHLFKKLDPAQGTLAFLVELYARHGAVVNEQTADGSDVENQGETTLQFVGDEGQLVKVILHSDVMRGRGSEEVRWHTLSVESEKTRSAGRRSIVTKVNDDARITQIEYNVLEALKHSQFSVATPISMSGAELTVEYSGVPLMAYAQTPGRDETQYAQYLVQATHQRLAISRALETILRPDEKVFLQERQVESMYEHFEERASRSEIGEQMYAWRVMRALGFEDAGFLKAYTNTVGRMLTTLPGEYYGWLRDNFAGNLAIDGEQVVSFDFNNLRYDVLLFDDAMLLDSYGLNVAPEVKEQCVGLTRKVINPDTPALFDFAYLVARLHRNLLQAGNILHEMGARGKGSLEEADHYWQCSQESWAALHAQRLVGVDRDELSSVQKRLHEAYAQRRETVSAGSNESNQSNQSTVAR
ncbi:MAG: hypothetical protein Q7R76_01495 [Candidatus Woesearchaeota archaeon]|nr:hypothetical protein [Candidatus Woesearchaeota archaeon]